MDMLTQTRAMLRRTSTPYGEIAKAVGISRETIHNLLNGSRDPRYSYVARLYDYLTRKEQEAEAQKATAAAEDETYGLGA